VADPNAGRTRAALWDHRLQRVVKQAGAGMLAAAVALTMVAAPAQALAPTYGRQDVVRQREAALDEVTRQMEAALEAMSQKQAAGKTVGTAVNGAPDSSGSYASASRTTDKQPM